MNKTIVLLLLSIGTLGCLNANPPVTADTEPAVAEEAVKQKPLEVGVFVDKGASGIGAVEWVRIVDESPDMNLHLLDGKSIREGALDGLDILVMPGGRSKIESKMLGPEGIRKMKEFIWNGGGYIGTCAGACLLMDEPKYRANITPWASRGFVSSEIILSFDMNEKGAKNLGLKKGPFKMRYHGGPFLWPTGNKIEGAKFESWATVATEAVGRGRFNKKHMYGADAILGGTYGKGRVFTTMAHPEYYEKTLYIIAAAFKYVSGGREVKFPKRIRKPRAVSVGYITSTGMESATMARALYSEKDFDLIPMNPLVMFLRGADHADVIVLINPTSLTKSLREFAEAGGKVIACGKGVQSLPKGGIVCKDIPEVIAKIKELFPAR